MTTPQAAPKIEITEAVQRLRQTLNARLVEQAAKGQAPWQRKLDPGQGERLPYNPLSASQQALQGINGLVLASIAQEKGFTDPRWVTKSQMEERGWGPIKGQSPASVEYYSDSFKAPRRDEQGNPMFDAKGDRVMDDIVRDLPQVHAVNMYNMSQIQTLQYARETIPELKPVKREPDLAALSKLVGASQIEVRPDGKNYFSNTEDHRGIAHVPLEEGMAKQQSLLRAVASKAVLMDGAAGARRVDTAEIRFAKQQLRIDITTQIMSEKLGIPTAPERMASFKDKYAQVLQADPDEIRYAGRDANRAVDRMVKNNFEPDKSRQRDAQQPAREEQRREPEQQQQQQQKQQREAGKPAQAKAAKKDKGLDR